MGMRKFYPIPNRTIVEISIQEKCLAPFYEVDTAMIIPQGRQLFDT
jgi:hypothetical protein